MNREQVISIVDSLARGVNPETVAPVPLELFGGTATTDAFAAVVEILRAPGSRPAAAGARWTEEEDLRLGREYDGGMPVRDIAREHGRSAAAITLRLVKLGRIDPATVQSRERGARVAS